MLHFSKLKASAVAFVILLASILAMPNIMSDGTRAALEGYAPTQKLTLGLDLQGGSHVLLEVDSASLKDVLAKQLVGDIRLRLRDAKIRYENLKRDSNGASVNIPDATQVEQAFTILRGLSQPVDTGLFG
ncbi:MAG: protein translocase subunit SecDF, partial [Anderseniella sp.]